VAPGAQVLAGLTQDSAGFWRASLRFWAPSYRRPPGRHLAHPRCARCRRRYDDAERETHIAIVQSISQSIEKSATSSADPEGQCAVFNL